VVVDVMRQDADVSIRRRALDLVLALVNEDNIQALTTELLDYLKVSRMGCRSPCCAHWDSC
jgi:Adaptin N terminal region